MRRPGVTTLAFAIPVLAVALAQALGDGVPFVDGGDGWHQLAPCQAVGIRETLSFNFSWTDRLGLGYPLRDDLVFQQLNPLNLLYLVCEPLRAFHVQSIVWLVLGALSPWLCFPRLFPRFGDPERAIFLAVVATNAVFAYLVKYQVVFLSSFAILPALWLAARRTFDSPGPAPAVAFLALLVLLVQTQYNFTLVPNLVLVALIVLHETLRAGLRSRRAVAAFAILALLLGGVAAFHVPNAIQLLERSNRVRDVEPLTPTHVLERLSAARLASRLVIVAGHLHIGPAHGILALLVVRSWRRSRHAGGPGALLLSIAVVLFDAVAFESDEYLRRVALLCAFPVALFTAIAAGGVVRGALRTVLGNPRRERIVLGAVAVPVALAAAHHAVAVAPWGFPPPGFGRTGEVAAYVAKLFRKADPADRDAFRATNVVRDDEIYTAELFTRYPYQPDQAIFFGRRDTSHYGNYLLEPGGRGSTWASRVSCVRRPGFFGNLDALTAAGVKDPIVRLLNVKYLVSPLELASPLATKIDTLPPLGVLTVSENLYRLAAPLPRAWTAPLPPQVAEVVGSNPRESTQAIEAFLEKALSDGALDERLEPLAVQQLGGTIHLSRTGVADGAPHLVFVSTAFWPEWEADDPRLVRVSPFGLLAFVARDPLPAEIRVSLRAPVARDAACASSVVLALALALWAARRRDLGVESPRGA